MHTDLEQEVRISVIIPTWNAGPELGPLLDKLLDQTLPPLEIIVVDSSSDDDTVAIARSRDVRLLGIDKRDFDHGGTRNYAARQARGNVLAFFTQDAMPAHRELLEELTRPLLDRSVAYVYGRQLPRDDASLLEKLVRGYNYSEEAILKSKDDLPRLGIKTFFCSNVCSAIRKELFDQMGGFASPVIFNEDLFMAANCILADYQVAYAPLAKVIHSHDFSFVQQFRRYFDNGVSMRSNPQVHRYSSVNNEGKRMIVYLIQELTRMKRRRWIPKVIVESIVKFVGFQLGKHYDRLPESLCRKLCSSDRLWNKVQMLQNEATPM
ncbi:glycosyltransferase family 2 protein [Cohnella zeiphila]|uniref:Glycosyltransferase family 2 protein n=1 Tax=Cohnella zeiphila TaxID=2761120 RepID=A0A7X0SLS6_9BACL|nr:glycosyltransferase family 2 protein [Cohnella zeiphila]MBB6732286.1 glycosyltransferase family 2 protein [Cohnella zeiphila]